MEKRIEKQKALEQMKIMSKRMMIQILEYTCRSHQIDVGGGTADRIGLIPGSPFCTARW